MGIINKIKQLAFRQKQFEYISKLNKQFRHKHRPCYYGRSKIFVDSFTGEAAPGVLETILLQLQLIATEVVVNPSLLNLGGGVGQLSEIFTYIGFDVVNTDIEIEKSDAKNIKIDFNKSTDLPFPDNHFDVIICQEVIEHIENPWNIFRIGKRYLKKDGTFFLTTPNIVSIRSKRLFNKAGYFKWFEPQNHTYHINPIPWWEILLIAEKTGFKIENIRGNGDFFFNYEKKLDLKSVLSHNDTLIFEAKLS